MKQEKHENIHKFCLYFIVLLYLTRQFSVFRIFFLPGYFSTQGTHCADHYPMTSSKLFAVRQTLYKKQELYKNLTSWTVERKWSLFFPWRHGNDINYTIFTQKQNFTLFWLLKKYEWVCKKHHTYWRLLFTSSCMVTSHAVSWSRNWLDLGLGFDLAFLTHGHSLFCFKSF